MIHQHLSNRRRALRSRTAFQGVLFLLALSTACGGSGPTSTVPMAPTTSSHFGHVAEHLHLGGTAYAYIDFDGDPLKLMTTLMGLLREVPEAQKMLGNITPEELVRILGLHNLRAFGFSSYKDGDHFHNRTFLRHTGPREGTMKIRGGAAAPFGVLNEAPADADLVVSQQINLKAFLEIAQALAEKGVVFQPAMLNAFVKGRALGMETTWEALIGKLDTEMSLVARVDPMRTIRLPEVDAPVPYTEFSIRAKGLGFLVEEAAKKYGTSPEVRVIRNDAMLALEPAQPLPKPLDGYLPALVLERSTGDLVIASTRTFLDSLRSASSSVSDTRDFKRVMRNTLSEGNAIAYLSPRLTRTLHDILDRFTQVTKDKEAAIGAEFVRWFLPDRGQPIGWVSTNLDEGILTASNTTSSHKARLILSSGGVASVGVIAAIGIPAFMKYLEQSKTAGDEKKGGE